MINFREAGDFLILKFFSCQRAFNNSLYSVHLRSVRNLTGKNCELMVRDDFLDNQWAFLVNRRFGTDMLNTALPIGSQIIKSQAVLLRVNLGYQPSFNIAH
jgi:hypothetical protein